MPKGANQKLKLLYLLKILTEQTDENHKLTIKEIIECLDSYGVSAERKSLYDDFEALRVYGIDVESSAQGKNTGYFVAERTFQLPELKLLVDAVQSSKFITRKKSGELIQKLSGLASNYEKKQLDRQVFVSNRVKTPDEQAYYNVDSIHNAIANNKRLKFKYYEWNAKKEKVLRHNGIIYEISPWALTWDDENYYMIGYDAKNDIIKHFRVDKMQGVTVEEQARLGEKHFENFDMAVYSKQAFGMFGGQLENVTLECDSSLAGVIIDRFGNEVMLIDDGDVFRVNVKVMVSNIFLSWVMGFGDKMKIVSPQGVIQKLKLLAQETLDNYE